jgi:hypothetical protein
MPASRPLVVDARELAGAIIRLLARDRAGREIDVPMPWKRLFALLRIPELLTLQAAARYIATSGTTIKKLSELPGYEPGTPAPSVRSVTMARKVRRWRRTTSWSTPAVGCRGV